MRSADPGDPIPVLTIVGHPCLERIGERVELTGLSKPGSSIELSRRTPIFHPPGKANGRALMDRRVSRKPLTLTAISDGGIEIDASGSPRSVMVNGSPVVDVCTLARNELILGSVLLIARRVVLYLKQSEELTEMSEDHPGIIGESSAIKRAREKIRQACRSDEAVLIRGETGTGKDVAARALHQQSGREAFAAVNLAGLPHELAYAELFGAEKGAYTGLETRRTGKIREVQGGSLFLDEIGDTPMETQPILLRFLEDKMVVPLGRDTGVPVDVRIITATNKNLEDAVARGLFREDLLYRLRSHEIRMPPLRDRREDLGLLLVHLLRQKLIKIKEKDRLDPTDPDSPWLPAEMVAELMLHDWPGNVRELRSVVEQIVSTAQSSDWHIDPMTIVSNIGDWLRHETITTVVNLDNLPTEVRQPDATSRYPAELSREQIVEAMRANQFNLVQAAKALGIGRSSLYKQMGLLGIKTTADLSADEITNALAEHGSVDAAAEALVVSAQGLLRRMKQLGIRP